MKTIILCGGKGTRMREETEYRPKPLVEIGGRPVLWHILKLYAHYGHNEFILTLGYKGDAIRKYFIGNRLLNHDFTLHTTANQVELHQPIHDDFHITCVDTGQESFTGERVGRVRPYVGNEEFMLTYGDGVGDIPVDQLIAFHRAQGTIGTITGSHPYSKWGLVKRDERTGLVAAFQEKPRLSDYVNSGFMVFTPRLFDYLDKGPIEETLMRLAQHRQLSLFEHHGFWKAMDTYQEMKEMNDTWASERPWAVWEK